MTRILSSSFPIAFVALSSVGQGFVPSVILKNQRSMTNTKPLHSTYSIDPFRTPVVDQSDFHQQRSIEHPSTLKPSTSTDLPTSTIQPTAMPISAVDDIEPKIIQTTTAGIEQVTPTIVLQTVANASSPMKKDVKKGIATKTNEHKDGVFSPVVYVAKDVLGEERLNKLRGEMIALHSDVIKGFVSTADSKIGQAILKQLFTVADKNKDGKIEKDELRVVFKTLRFEWLNDKQLNGIFERADLDHNGEIDMEEWMKEAPKTLKTNLVKLAKSNGGKMGLLV